MPGLAGLARGSELRDSAIIDQGEFDTLNAKAQT